MNASGTASAPAVVFHMCRDACAPAGPRVPNARRASLSLPRTSPPQGARLLTLGALGDDLLTECTRHLTRAEIRRLFILCKEIRATLRVNGELRTFLAAHDTLPSLMRQLCWAELGQSAAATGQRLSAWVHAWAHYENPLDWTVPLSVLHALWTIPVLIEAQHDRGELPARTTGTPGEALVPGMPRLGSGIPAMLALCAGLHALVCACGRMAAPLGLVSQHAAVTRVLILHDMATLHGSCIQAEHAFRQSIGSAPIAQPTHEGVRQWALRALQDARTFSFDRAADP